MNFFSFRSSSKNRLPYSLCVQTHSDIVHQDEKANVHRNVIIFLKKMPLNMKDRTASCETPGLPREPIFRGDYIFNTGQIKHFSYLDYNFFVFTLFVSTFIGFYQAWRSRSNVGLDEYFLASRSMSAFPVSLSLMASFSSSLLIMGTSAEVYVFSTIYFWMGATYIVGTLIAAYTFIPIFYNLKITSVYEVNVLVKCSQILFA